MAADKLLLRKQRTARDKDAGTAHLRQRKFCGFVRRAQISHTFPTRPVLCTGWWLIFVCAGGRCNAVGLGAPAGQLRSSVRETQAMGPNASGCDTMTAPRCEGMRNWQPLGGEWLALIKRRGGRVRNASLGRRRG
ncbi:uncharacterized protein CC84DRAFT_436860 [Paraphaeosphaeria sporulosa]|uniref:Uncharacterized protein n=1 Tax=Paraphaeosphaeria sporulosa TaxID=1460663 RepID=A0A177CQD3_9PLEO|nr:uncharacterized protein CC84DRAFT_436860 [Paraphaeosphaeria sporulosa]OAG09431.1 hypothetical protein CC84DRAFT_436860 [Paraphaeosphaeria sporulosa]